MAFIHQIVTQLTNYLTASIRMYAGKSTVTRADYWIDVPDFYISGRSFTGQAHGGYNVKTFTSGATFNADDGNNQVMTCTGDTTIAISNELPGIYIIDLPISGSGVSSITIGASLGTAYTDNNNIAYTDGSQNTITLFVNGNGSKKYTITAIEA